LTSDWAFEFIDVVVERDGVRAVNQLTARIPRSGVTVVFGPSGSGKSTLLRLCNRLEMASSGRVLFSGLDIAETDPMWLRRRVGMCFQRPTSFGGTVRDNLLAARTGGSDRQMTEVLDSVALSGAWLDRNSSSLSGGEAQRMCLARALMARPEVLLLDEPTSALDCLAARAIEVTVRNLVDINSIPVVWVTHDRGQLERIADHVVHVHRGRCVGTELFDRRSAREQMFG
jgi:putative ABC transport system ATP-binding protein